MKSNTLNALKLMFEFSCKRARRLNGKDKYKEWLVMQAYSAMIMTELRK